MYTHTMQKCVVLSTSLTGLDWESILYRLQEPPGGTTPAFFLFIKKKPHGIGR